VPTAGEPDTRAAAPADPWLAALHAQASACEAELATTTDPPRAARLHFEIGRLCESALGDLRRAATHYQEALAKAPDHVGAIRGARRVLIARKSFQAGLALFDAEARLLPDPRRKSALFLAKGRLLEDVLGQRAEAREAYAMAHDLDRTDVAALHALAQHDLASEQWEALARDVERIANAVAGDPRHRAALIALRARLFEHRLGQVDAAIELYETALALDPDAPGALGALKRLLHQQRRWRDLIGVLEREAGRSPSPAVRAMALYRIGRLHSERLGNRDEAIAALERAARDAPNDVLVREELARLYEAAERWEPLVETLRALADATGGVADGTSGAGRQGRGVAERVARLHRIGLLCEERLGDEDRAIEAHRQALVLDPTFVPSLQALGKLLQKREAWDALCEMHLGEAAAVAEPRRRAAAHARVAEILEQQLGRVEDAAEQHARALALAPGYAASFKALERIYAQLGRHRELVEVYERALDVAPSTDHAVAYLFKIGGIYEDRLGDHALAAHAYRRVIDLDAGNLGALHALQRATERAGRWAEHAEALEREAERCKDPAQIVALLHRAGEVLDEQVGDREAALARFRKVVAIDPTYVPVLASLGRIYYRSGRWADLLEMYERELQVTPRGPGAVTLLLKMGELCEERLGRDEDALGFYRRAVEIDPTGAPALGALARKLQERGSWEELARVREIELAAIADAPHRALACYRLGEIHEERLGRPEQALAFYEQALRAAPDYRPAVDALVRLRTETRGFAKLADDLAREAAETTDDALAIAARLHEGEVCADELRDPRRAIAAYEAVLERSPGHLGALLALEPLLRRTGQWQRLCEVYAALARLLVEPAARAAALRELVRVQEAHGLGSPDDLRKTWETLLALVPGDPQALAALERLALETGDRRGLARVDSELGTREADPALAAAHRTRLGESLEALGDATALAAYRAALAADPEALGAARGLGRVAERTGDERAMAEAARREAMVTRDPEARARLLVRGARLRARRLGDLGGAVDDLDRALEAWPDDAQAAELLRELLGAPEDAARLSELLARAAGSARSPERQAALWTEVARLQAGPLGNTGAGIAALQRALRSAPGHVPTHMALAALYERDGQWQEAAAALGKAVQLAGDAETQRDAHLGLARLYADKPGEESRALASLQAVLALEPQHREALRRLALHHAREGDTARAFEVAQRLLTASAQPAERVEALLLVHELAAQVGDAKSMRDAIAEAVAIEGPSGRAAQRYRASMEQSGGWERYAGALVRHITVFGGSGDVASYLELSAVQDDELGLREESIATLREALARLGDDPRVREALGRRLRRAGKLDEALRELARNLVVDVTRPETYRELARTYEGLRRTEEVRYALAPLVALGVAEPREAEQVRAKPPRAGHARPGALDAEALRAIEAGARHELALSLLATLGEGLGKLYPADLEAFGVGGRDKIGPRSGHALRALTDRVAAVFGVAEYDLYIHRVRGRGVALELSEPVSVLVPAALAELPEAQQVFAVARAFAAVARGLASIEKLTPRELEVAVAAAVRTVVPGFGGGLTADDLLDEQGRRLVKALSRRTRKAFEDLAPQYAAGAPPEYATWVRGLQQTANRAALVVCDDLPGAVEALRRLERGEPGALEGAALAKASPVVADVLRFWVSEAAAALRRRAGYLPATA
jgi:tetratricopeptide (TPR) repeat protein